MGASNLSSAIESSPISHDPGSCGFGDADTPVANHSQLQSCLQQRNQSNIYDYYNYDSTELKDSPYVEHYLLPAIFGTVFAVGLIGNGVVVYVLVRMRRGAMKTITNLYLLNLALADLLLMVCCVPFTGVVYMLPNWPFGLHMCKLVNYMMPVTMATSVFTMTAMSIDRYHAVVRPVRSKAYRTVQRTLIILGTIWVVNIICLSPVAKIAHLVPYWDYGATHSFCIMSFETVLDHHIYTLSLFLFYYVTPLCTIGACYFLMAKNLWHSVSPSFLQENTVKALKSRRRVSKMVLVLVLVFAVCWLPIHIVQLYIDFGPPTYSLSFYAIKILAHCLAYANSALNPIIYSFMSETFRKCCKAAFAGCKCRKSGEKRVFVVVDPEALPMAQPLPHTLRPPPEGATEGNNHLTALRVDPTNTNKCKVQAKPTTQEML